MAVKYWVDQMAADADVKIRDRRDELFDMELEKFVAGIVGSQGVGNRELTWMWHERAILDPAKLNLYYYNTLILPIRLSFYAPLSSAGVGYTHHHKYLNKKYEGV